MRIDEKRSSSRGGAGRGHWLHPDLVGIQLLSEDWGKQSQQLAKFYNTDLIKVWSFEVKVRLSISNVRSKKNLDDEDEFVAAGQGRFERVCMEADLPFSPRTLYKLMKVYNFEKNDNSLV